MDWLSIQKHVPKNDTSMTLHSKNYYTFVESRKDINDKNDTSVVNNIANSQGVIQPPFSNIGSNASIKSVLRKITESTPDASQSNQAATPRDIEDFGSIMTMSNYCDVHPWKHRLPGSLAVPREPLDAATVAEAIIVITLFPYDIA
ncbi:hypothetical protein KIW84_057683 [Lathyrus oleraceus]|uniref:Uncharacterized protein n=1 Tax=Pisum sativum TaxID=3888 RepID=A0A9D4X2V8_PEA|nr:hypothetical protein KIW84_057683 [Pisum sativum]